MAHRPLIGVVPLWDDTLNSLWMLPGYFDGIAEAGGIPVMLPLTDDETIIGQLVGQCDGFLVTGGHDVDPERYGEAAGPKTVKLCKARDRMEERLIPSVIAADKPLLGICRGIQSLNVALGGTLWQDLPDEHPSPVVHHGDKPPYDPVVHEVSIAPDSPLARALWPLGDNGPSEAEADEVDSFGRPYHPRAYTLGVNSYHHQAIRTLGQGLEPMATAPDSIVEAVWMPAKRFVWAVQWHPEFSQRADSNQRRILSAFIDAC